MTDWPAGQLTNSLTDSWLMTHLPLISRHQVVILKQLYKLWLLLDLKLAQFLWKNCDILIEQSHSIPVFQSLWFNKAITKNVVNLQEPLQRPNETLRMFSVLHNKITLTCIWSELLTMLPGYSAAVFKFAKLEFHSTNIYSIAKRILSAKFTTRFSLKRKFLGILLWTPDYNPGL